MNRRYTIAAATLLLASGLAWTLATHQSPPSEPPAQLIKSILPGTAGKAVYGDLVRSWYDWATPSMTVTITRRERQDLNSVWDEQRQELSTSYYVVDARVTVDAGQQVKDLYLAGVYPNGDSCLERWAFSYPLVQGWPYVPISQRPLPSVRRTELFRGSQYGHIRCVEPDPDGRFLLFLTLETPTVYRRPLPSGPITTELNQAMVPILAESAQILARHHVTGGRQLHIIKSSRWHADLSEPQYTIVLPDPENDGTFGAPIVLSSEAWNQLGYDDPAVWTLFD